MFTTCSKLIFSTSHMFSSPVNSGKRDRVMWCAHWLNELASTILHRGCLLEVLLLLMLHMLLQGNCPNTTKWSTVHIIAVMYLYCTSESVYLLYVTHIRVVSDQAHYVCFWLIYFGTGFAYLGLFLTPPHPETYTCVKCSRWQCCPGHACVCNQCDCWKYNHTNINKSDILKMFLRTVFHLLLFSWCI